MTSDHKINLPVRIPAKGYVYTLRQLLGSHHAVEIQLTAIAALIRNLAEYQLHRNGGYQENCCGVTEALFQVEVNILFRLNQSSACHLVVE